MMHQLVLHTYNHSFCPPALIRVPGVVKLCGTAEDHSSVYLVFDQCAGGDLYARLAHRGLLSEQQLATEVRVSVWLILAQTAASYVIRTLFTN